MVHKKIKSNFIKALIKEIERSYGNNQKISNDYGRIAHLKHFKNLELAIKDEQIIYGGQTDEKSLYFSPTLVEKPKKGSQLLKKEIFGPILPIIDYEEEKDIHEFLRG